MWQHVLQDALDDDEAIQFLQKAAGYSLTGDTREEKLFLVLGPEATGKSTLLEAMKAVMGDYAMTASFDTFTKKQGDSGIRNDVARLQGARLVTCSEVNDGKAFDESLVKSVTGGDTITARYLHRENFEYVPDFKLWLAANHAPNVDADDGAMWRRILRIPFERTIPKDWRDATIKPFLKDPEGGGPAVLAWMVEGCLLWQVEGLKTPTKVERATDAYRDDMDPICDFISDCCELVPDGQCSNRELRDAYETWCHENRIKNPISPKAMASRLQARGCRSGRSRKARFWQGLRLTRDTCDACDSSFDNFPLRKDSEGKLWEMGHEVSHPSQDAANIIENNLPKQFEDDDDWSEARAY